jgi:two-component system response regulator FixJ
VDDDEAVRDSLRWLLEASGFTVVALPSAEQLLSLARMPRQLDDAGCLVLDVRMPGMSGLDLQDELAALDIEVPIIFLTGFGEVPTAVRAMKNGAFDFVEKPAPSEWLIDCVRTALESDRKARRQRARRGEIQARLVTLTPREQQVLALVIEGRSSKRIADILGDISHKTVEVHRARIMRKMRAESVANLVSMVIATNTSTGRWPR